MYFQIRKLVLWPKKENRAYKEISFQLGKINVITGSSRTGKSAIIPIVDYCLGSKECSIPVSIIRDACSWFGVVIKTKDSEMLLARKEPGNKKSTDEMMFIIDKEITIPEVPYKNNSRERVCRSLDEIAKITFQNIGEDEENGFNSRPSFRDMMAFSYQPQNIIANANTLFYKADTMEHRQKIINIFPYILGALNGDVLEKRKRIEILKKELKKKEKELENLQRVSLKWEVEIKSWLKKAQGVGLLDKSLKFDNLTYDGYLNYLSEVSEKCADNVNVSSEGIELTLKDINELKMQEREISNKLVLLSNRKREMMMFYNNISEYAKNLCIQRDRLAIADWIFDLSRESSICPFCGVKHKVDSKIHSMVENLKRIETEIEDTKEIPASFEREFSLVNGEINTLSEQLTGVQNGLKTLEYELHGENKGYTLEEISKFIGRIQYAKEVYSNAFDNDVLEKNINNLNEQIKELQKEVNEREIARKINNSLREIQKRIMKKLPDLDLENPYNQVNLDYKNLTLRIDNNGREDYLWQIGSGSNWISYHLATILSIHEFAASSSSSSPLAQFLIIDQPSQVYFPRKLSEKSVSDDQKLEDEDIIAVNKMFKVMSSSIKEQKENIQIIVLEHAGEEVWQDVDNVNKVCEWREENERLIPTDWLE